MQHENYVFIVPLVCKCFLNICIARINIKWFYTKSCNNTKSKYGQWDTGWPVARFQRIQKPKYKWRHGMNTSKSVACTARMDGRIRWLLSGRMSFCLKWSICKHLSGTDSWVTSKKRVFGNTSFESHRIKFTRTPCAKRTRNRAFRTKSLMIQQQQMTKFFSNLETVNSTQSWCKSWPTNDYNRIHDKQNVLAKQEFAEVSVTVNQAESHSYCPSLDLSKRVKS